MSRPTTTRAQLRQAIGVELGMPFYKDYGTNSTITTATSTTKLIDSTLLHDKDTWKNCWMLITSGSPAGTHRRVEEFWYNTGLTLERPFASSAVVGDTYELTSVFSPPEIHQAINRAIVEAFPAFYDTTTDETLIVQEDKLTYDLTGLTTRPWVISKVWFERGYNVNTGTATSGAVGYLIDTSANFSSITTSYKVSIYDGTGKGQIRTIGSVTGTTQLNPSVAFTTAPDSTSKYALWNPEEEVLDHYRILPARFDQKEYPNTMYLSQRYPDLYGMRIRLEYNSIPSELTTDSSTTIVPKEFIINKAISYLATSKTADNRADRQRWSQVAQQYMAVAEQYKKVHAWQQPAITMWQEEERGNPRTVDQQNPLGWGG